MGGDPSAYKRTLPAHLFPQWGFPLATRVMSTLDYPFARVLNAGCHFEMNAPLPNDVPLTVRARIESIDDNGSRALIHTRIVTGTAEEPNALVGTLSAIVPLSKKKKGDKKKKDEITREMLEDLDQPDEDPILELLDDIQENMRAIEEMLNKKQTGASTQEIQSSTVERIDKLIEEAIKAGAT